MSNEELKDALFRGCPVKYNGIVYLRVSAIIYRNCAGKLLLSAELLDRNQNSVTVVPPQKVQEVTL